MMTKQLSANTASTSKSSGEQKKGKLPKAVIAQILAKKRNEAFAAAAAAQKSHRQFPLPSVLTINRPAMLDKSIFTATNLRLVGQANKELLLVLLLESKSEPVPSADTAATSATRPLLLALDQHAVHERIRLETLRKACFNGRTGAIVTRRISPPAEYTISETLWQQMSQHLEHFEQIVGLKCSLKKGTKTSQVSGSQPSSPILIVSQIASCFRDYTDSAQFLAFLEDSLTFFADAANLLPADGHIARPRLSPFLLEQLKSQACRGAIRFGEELTTLAASSMLGALANCKQPFRCAHGRTLLKPTNYLPTEGEMAAARGDNDAMTSSMNWAMNQQFIKRFGGGEVKVEIVEKYIAMGKKEEEEAEEMVE